MAQNDDRNHFIQPVLANFQLRLLTMPRLLLLLFVILVSCRPEPATLLLVNGKIWTGDGPESFVEAVAIRANRIVYTGTTSALATLRGENTRVVDLQGKLVIAGFNDAHIHFLGGVTGFLETDLSQSKTGKGIVETVNKFAAGHPEKTWITGRGWQYTWFPSGLPTPADLDGIAADRPVYLRSYDGHSAWANAKALELAGVTAQSRIDGAGEIVLDAKGQPTGALLEGAQDLVSKWVPKYSREEKLAALRQGMLLAARLGLTSLQNASGSLDELALYEELAASNELTVRYSGALSVDEHTTEDELNAYRVKRDALASHPLLRSDAIKFMLDGVIESHTAAMLEPYDDMPESTGGFTLPQGDYRRLVTELDSAGFRLYTHGIGDLAVREALNAYEAAARTNGARPRRHRIEHIENINPQDLPRFVSLGVMPSMEPIHADPGAMAVWEKAVGPARLPWSFAWNSILSTGAVLVFSSDWPACIDLNPIRGIHVAVNRRTPEGFPPEGWVAGQRITVAQALAAYTKAGAYSSFEEAVKGQIKPGYLADIVVLSDDLFTMEPMKIFSTRVVMTIFDGRVIYEETGEN